MSDIELPILNVRSRPTMRDVAALAGVALKTVSRVMNDVPTVDPELTRRVRAAADKLGYRPNLAASNLRRSGGRTGTVGLLVEDVANPFSAALHRAVEDVMRAAGILLLTGSLDEDADRERALARTLIDRRVDGLIIVPSGEDYRWVVAEQDAGTAFVFVDRVPSPLIADAIQSDNAGAAALGVQHLLAAGHRRIAFLGDRQTIQTARERCVGFRQALGQAGVPIEEALIRTGISTAADAHAATTELLRTTAPTAIFASQNLILVGAVRALHELSLQHTIALVGLDDLVLADLIEPAITVVAQKPAEIGRLAAHQLLRRLGTDHTPPAVRKVSTEVIVRGSGEIRPPAGAGDAAGVS